MSMDRWVDPRVSQVKVANLRSYLEAHGWQLKPFPRPQALKYEGPPDDEGEPIVLMAPSSEKLSDYRWGVVSIITTLSVLEDRHPVEILNEILGHDACGQARGEEGANAASRVAGAKRKGNRSHRKPVEP
jgi:hypothetical protein